MTTRPALLLTLVVSALVVVVVALVVVWTSPLPRPVLRDPCATDVLLDDDVARALRCP